MPSRKLATNARSSSQGIIYGKNEGGNVARQFFIKIFLSAIMPSIKAPQLDSLVKNDSVLLNGNETSKMAQGLCVMLHFCQKKKDLIMLWYYCSMQMTTIAPLQ